MLGLLFIFLASLTWALDTLIRYPLLKELSAHTIVLIEHFLLTLVFLPLLWPLRKRIGDIKLSTIFYFLVVGGLGSALATLAFTHAFSLISPSMVILLQKLQPLVAILLARFVLGERLSKAFMFWAFWCLVGALLISHREILPGLEQFELRLPALWGREGMGIALTLLAVVSWGAATVFGKKLSHSGFSAREIMAGRFLTGLLVLLPTHEFSRLPLVNLQDPAIWGKLIGMSALSGLVGMSFYYRGLKRLTARQCTLAELFFPLCAVLVNWYFLEMALDPIQLLGGGLLLVSSTIIQLKHY